jgi:hypothetical protein
MLPSSVKTVAAPSGLGAHGGRAVGAADRLEDETGVGLAVRAPAQLERIW